VSYARAMKPYSPMENFSFMILPPAADTRPASTAQSLHPK